MSKVKTYILEISKSCNQACPFCYSISCNPYNKTMQLAGEEWMKAIRNIIRNGAESIDFSGGEPTLHPDFNKIIEYAGKKGTQIIVSTNGVTVDNYKIRQSIDQNADFVSLSIHGSKPEIHESITRAKGAYQRAHSSLQHYYANNIKTGKTKIKVNTVACQQNLEDVANIGGTLKIENKNIIWKISQAIPREKGYKNKDHICTSDEQFKTIQEQIIAKYPIAYSQGRILFREDDSNKEQYSPYMIAKADGQLHIPKGESHASLGVSILEKNLGTRIRKAYSKLMSNHYESFTNRLKENHKKNYN